METQEAVFRILRFNPEKDEKPQYTVFHVSIDEQMTVLDALEKIKHEQDPTLTFRRSCRSGICGSCTMKINGLAKLACKTRASLEVAKHEEVLVEPMENMPTIRDLVVDMGEFWNEINRGKPWLMPDETVTSDITRENLLITAQQQVSSKLADCIMCGACFADCISRVFDKNFTGPASLAKVYRFVADPRDKGGDERISPLVGMGLWSCTHCYMCWSQCPRDVRPVAAISELRTQSVAKGDSSQGARHVKVFMDSIYKTGALNEAALYLETLRLGVLKDLDLIVRLGLKGKAPSFFKKAIPQIDEVRLIYRLAGEGKR